MGDVISGKQTIVDPLGSGYMLDFSQSSPDAIIRDDLKERVSDWWHTHRDAMAEDPFYGKRNLVIDIAAIIGGAAASVGAYALTKSSIVSTAAAMVGDKLVRGIGGGFLEL